VNLSLEFATFCRVKWNSEGDDGTTYIKTKWCGQAKNQTVVEIA